MSYYPEPDSHTRDKVKLMLDCQFVLLKKQLNDDSGVDTSNLAAKSGFIVLKVEFDKLNTNKLVSFPTSLNNLKTKLNDLDVAKLKTVPINLKKLSDVVDKK